VRFVKSDKIMKIFRGERVRKISFDLGLIT
jgi:hypothetical protein